MLGDDAAEERLHLLFLHEADRPAGEVPATGLGRRV